MMKNPFIYENSLFISALFVSTAIHGFFIGANGLITSMPYASVVNAPSSLEVIVLNEAVVSILEDEIISQEIMGSDSPEEVVFNDQVRNLDPEKNIQLSLASKESLGAVIKAEPLSYVNPAPPYPHIARQRGWEGTVRLEVFVDKGGAPGEVTIAKSSGYGVLDKAALKAVEHWQFSPARSGAMRFSSKITIPVQFTLIKK